LKQQADWIAPACLRDSIRVGFVVLVEMFTNTNTSRSSKRRAAWRGEKKREKTLAALPF